MEAIIEERIDKRVPLLGLLIFMLGAVFYSYEYLLRISPSVMTAQLMEHFNVNASMLGQMSAFYYYAYVPMQLPVGMLMDKLGPRRLLTAACLICVAGTYLFIWTDNVWFGSLGRFIVGFGSAFAFVGVLKLASIWLPRKRFAMFAGISAALGTIGAMGGAKLLMHWVSYFGWYKTVRFSAGIGLVLAIILYFVIRDKSSHPERDVDAPAHTEARSFRELASVLINPRMWLIGLIGCFIYLPTTVFAELWGVSYLQATRHFTPDEAVFAVDICLFLGFTMGAPFFGWLSDFLQTRKKLLLGAALFSTAVVATVLYLPGLSVVQLNFLLCLLGFSYSAQALVFTVGRELSPSAAEGTAVAVTNMIVMMGPMFLQPLAGILMDWSWSSRASAVMTSGVHVYSPADYQFALMLVPCGMLFSAILTLFLKETYGTEN